MTFDLLDMLSQAKRTTQMLEAAIALVSDDEVEQDQPGLGHKRVHEAEDSLCEAKRSRGSTGQPAMKPGQQPTSPYPQQVVAVSPAHTYPGDMAPSNVPQPFVAGSQLAAFAPFAETPAAATGGTDLGADCGAPTSSPTRLQQSAVQQAGDAPCYQGGARPRLITTASCPTGRGPSHAPPAPRPSPPAPPPPFPAPRALPPSPPPAASALATTWQDPSSQPDAALSAALGGPGGPWRSALLPRALAQPPPPRTHFPYPSQLAPGPGPRPGPGPGPGFGVGLNGTASGASGGGAPFTADPTGGGVRITKGSRRLRRLDGSGTTFLYGPDGSGLSGTGFLSGPDGSESMLAPQGQASSPPPEGSPAPTPPPAAASPPRDAWAAAAAAAAAARAAEAEAEAAEAAADAAALAEVLGLSPPADYGGGCMGSPMGHRPYGSGAAAEAATEAAAAAHGRAAAGGGYRRRLRSWNAGSSAPVPTPTAHIGPDTGLGSGSGSGLGAGPEWTVSWPTFKGPALPPISARGPAPHQDAWNLAPNGESGMESVSNSGSRIAASAWPAAGPVPYVTAPVYACAGGNAYGVGGSGSGGGSGDGMADTSATAAASEAAAAAAMAAAMVDAWCAGEEERLGAWWRKQ
ncbi:hypothetical protein HYH03_009816 [Edaphochlamys debaryana]|uniref:Uncharacterized protein n=1 Tax=Edaphochlamys debaryana TaxID=47281 RepID=A0A836BXB8_9CHLO|nr:hypothetical protein HYH03_009816 [Edaphochlamys debaryana]|eukprot:KAG2491862.1 hypothetical protein HYH03_009816 [Edaphochlamys debaryana]